ncbi:MAG: DUF4430 domain-containing protein [Clostridiales Family XIII bacterium]|jgi:hypothetical protein|nr:DUF4430 domain-containing protein [Clostridiales Family XIII bacterium]
MQKKTTISIISIIVILGIVSAWCLLPSTGISHFFSGLGQSKQSTSQIQKKDAEPQKDASESDTSEKKTTNEKSEDAAATDEATTASAIADDAKDSDTLKKTQKTSNNDTKNEATDADVPTSTQPNEAASAPTANPSSPTSADHNQPAPTSTDNTQANASQNQNPAPAVENKHTCTFSIECGKILDNIAKLDPAKVGIVPKNGIIYAKQTVAFNEGDSAFDLLKRETRNNGIHLEFTNTPAYNSAYIEGIANLYEFDCGSLSGWIYSVNGQFANNGSSNYKLKDGDSIEFHYTCDLGRDFGVGF